VVCMNIGFQLFRMKNKVMGRLFPQQVVANACEMFFTPRKHPIKSWESSAEAKGIRVKLSDGLSVIVWGQGAPVLMMHGWEGRATQMAAFIEPLNQLGFQVVALDAPAHGHSQGRQANPVRFAEAMLEVDKQLGPFHAVIGHSMGAGAAIYAIKHGLRTNKLVAISSPASFYRVLRRFAIHIGFSDKLVNRFLKHAEEVVGIPFANIELGELVNEIAVEGLFIHDQEDAEIPHSESNEMAHNMPNGRLYSTQGLGHRKIMRSPLVIDTVSNFIVPDPQVILF
jgi:pimeloyl-ACP methyl ester carboxylesterase